MLLIGVDLPFVVVSATSVKNAVALSLELAIIHMVTLLLSFLLARKMKRWQRAVFAVVVSTATMLFAQRLVVSIFPESVNFIQFHLYLMAFNGMTLLQTIFLREDTSFGRVAASGAANVLAFSLFMTLAGGIREYLSAGTLWGQPLGGSFRLRSAAAPFFGFILLGFLLAGWRVLSRKVAAGRIRDRARQDAAHTQQ